MERAIGIIDSGLGGITVAEELMRQLPKEKLIYLGDTKRCPYGSRPKEEVKKFTWEMVHFLLQHNIKLLVVACNTATAFTLADLKKQLNIPVIGVIHPGARAAIKSTKSSHVGVIGTEGTIKSNAYAETLKRINPKIEIHSVACPSFVPLVESGNIASKEAKKIVNESLSIFHDKLNIDTLILGCTHYPIIKDLIQGALGKDVTLVSSSEETARETSVMLEVHQILNQGERVPEHLFFTTGNLQSFKTNAKTIFHKSNKIFHQITCKSVII